MQINFNFYDVNSLGREKLAKELSDDKASTSYNDKNLIINQITDEKINGFVVNLMKEEGGSSINAGFILYNEQRKVLVMYTFENGRGHYLFNHIVGHLLSTGWDKVEVEYDDNNEKMRKFFEAVISNLK